MRDSLRIPLKRALLVFSVAASLPHSCEWKEEAVSVSVEDDFESGFVSEPGSYRKDAIGEQLLFRWTPVDASARIPLFVELADGAHELPINADGEVAVDLVKQALDHWLTQSALQVEAVIRLHSEGERFTKNESIILVRFVNDPSAEARAMTRMYSGANKQVKEIVIDFPVPAEGFAAYSQRLMTHEFGHALGCLADDGLHSGHSPHEFDLMHAQVTERDPSPSDYATMREIYSAEPYYRRADEGSLDAAGNGSQDQAAGWGRWLPSPRSSPWYGITLPSRQGASYAWGCCASCSDSN